MASLRAIAADANREATARVPAGRPAPPPEHGSILVQMLTVEMGGELLGHAVGVAGLEKVGFKIATMGASAQLSRMRVAGLRYVDDIPTAAVLNPEIARVILTGPVPSSRPAVAMKLRGLLGNLATDGMLRTRESSGGR